MLWLALVPLIAFAAAAALMPYETLRESRRCALRLDGTHSARRAHAEARARRALVVRMAVLPALVAALASVAASAYLAAGPSVPASAAPATSAEDAALHEAERLRETEREAARRASREVQSLGLDPLGGEPSGQGAPEASAPNGLPGFAPGFGEGAPRRAPAAPEPATAADVERALDAEADGLSAETLRAAGTAVALALVLLALVAYVLRARRLYRTDLRSRRKRYYHADTERLAAAPPAS